MRTVRFNCAQTHTKTSSGLGFRDLDQLVQAPVHGSFGRVWPALEPKLPQRQRWMTQPELRSFAQARRELGQTAITLEPTKGLELRVGGSARADEVRLVRVREPVRTSLRLAHHGPLVDGQR